MPGFLFRWVDSLWMAQDSRRHCLGGVGTSANYLSLIPFDGVSSGMGVLGSGRGG